MDYGSGLATASAPTSTLPAPDPTSALPGLSLREALPPGEIGLQSENGSIRKLKIGKQA